MTTTWSALRAELADEIAIRDEEARGFVGFTRSGREVHVQQTAGDTVGWVLLRTPVCPQGEMDPALTLERNGELAFTVLTLTRGTYWLRIAVPLDSTELGDPRRLLALLVSAADSLRPRRASASIDSNVFQNYAA